MDATITARLTELGFANVTDFQTAKGLVADGIVGPKTRLALWPEKAVDLKVLNPLPSQSDVLAFRSPYGDPRGKDASTVSSTWYAKNMVRVPIPFVMTYAGTPLTKGLMFHRYCAPHFAKLFDLLLDAAKGKQETLDHWGVSITGGSFNYRLMRGLNTLSMHSFGCALDLDPARNGLGDATPRFAEFPEVLKTFRESGLCWGGDWNGNGSSADQRRHDGMHLQATLPIN